jgi:Ca2+-binding RTX toxin-like protein
MTTSHINDPKPSDGAPFFEILESRLMLSAWSIGTSGDDVIDGTDGRDMIICRSGDDIAFGLDGNDMLLGGRGDDILQGGSGRDDLLPKN